MEDKVREILSNRDRGEEKFDEQLITSCRQFFSKWVEFRPASQSDSYLENLRARYKPLNKVNLGMEDDVADMDTAPPLASSSGSHGDQGTTNVDGVPHPKRILYNPELLEMKWKNPQSVGCGLSNMGNTCFLNSVLQCLTYTPPLHHLLMSGNHKQLCRTQGFCAMCELERHSTRAFNTPSGVMRPVPIVQNLKAIAKHFRQGRQEDAHEFLRYFVDGLQKSCLQGCPPKLDPHSKATTAVHQIFGGYHRSQVKCLECMKTSDTFDPLLDISLDIKNCQSLSKALQKSTKPDLLDEENKYACPFCKKMTKAQKKFTIHRLPRVLTIQLKRFEYSGLFGGKINKPVTYTEYVDMRPYMSEPQGPSKWYRLYSVLVHFGYSSHSGHYYCYIRNSNGVWYCMNDSQVTQVSLTTVLQQEAYLLFYIRDDEYCPSAKPASSSASPAAKGSTQNLKVRPDPNFLGTPVVRHSGVDKTGTPLIKPLQKPTGVVTPSPQTTPHTHKVPTPNNGGLTHEFSIPLRKTGINSERQKQAAASVVSPPDQGAEPQKAASAPPAPTLHPTFKGPGFTPRIIAAGPKPKKLHKSTLFPKVVTPAKVVGEPSSAIETPPAGAEHGKNGEEVAAESTRNESESGRVQTVLDIAEMTLSENSATCIGHPSTLTKEQKFIGPLLPPQFHSPPLSPTVQPFTFMSTTSKSPKVARVQPQRHSPQPSVKPIARVLPSPQVPSSREQTTIQEEESLKEPDSTKERSEDGRESDGSSHNKSEERGQIEKLVKDNDVGDSDKKAESSDTVTPSDHGPHVNSRVSWKVMGSSKPFGPALPDDYDTNAHGWTVTPMKSPPVEPGHDSFKVKKKHKKKRYRMHSTEYDSESQSQSDVETSRKATSFTEKQSDTREREKQGRVLDKSSHRRHNSDGSRKPNYRSREHCLSPERNSHQDSRDNSSLAHRKHKRHHSEYFGSREQMEKKKRHHSDVEERHPRKQSPEKFKRRHHRSPSTSGSECEYRHRRRAPMREDYLPHRHVESKHNRHYYRHRLPDSRPWGIRGRYPPGGYLDRSKHSMGHQRVERFRHIPADRREKYYHHHRQEHERSWEKERDRDIPGRHRKDSDKEYERPGRKHFHSHRHCSPSLDRERHEHGSKRLKDEAAFDNRHRREERRRSPVPEVEWDASLKHQGRDGGGYFPHSRSQWWDGSQHSEVVERLTSRGHDVLGDILKSWDGGKNAIDSDVMERDSRKRGRDPWDEELDQGKIKKMKTAKEEDHRSSYHKNLFQECQNRKNKLSHQEKSAHHYSRLSN